MMERWLRLTTLPFVAPLNSKDLPSAVLQQALLLAMSRSCFLESLVAMLARNSSPRSSRVGEGGGKKRLICSIEIQMRALHVCFNFGPRETGLLLLGL